MADVVEDVPAPELKPCPFCGGTNIEMASTGLWWVGCNTCMTEGPTASTRDDAAKAWNTRATFSEA